MVIVKMPALHIVSKSPHANSALADCLVACGEHATILLIEDAVTAALIGSDWADRLDKADHQIMVLTEDCVARGISTKIAAKFRRVDYAQFVQLCCDHTPIVSWY